MEAYKITALSRLFSSSVILEMARRGKSPIFARLVREIDALGEFSACHRVRDIFDAAFNTLKRKANRHEYVYKSALTHKILLGTHSLQTASMLTEFRVGSCKADLAILNGTATVYEIKSERDSLSRLATQIEAYREVFASVYVIAGENHLDQVIADIPSDVGVMMLHSRYRLSTLREAHNLPERTNPEAIFGSIRLDEAKAILLRNGLPVPSVPNTERFVAFKEQFVKLTPMQAHKGMVEVLKESRNLLPLSNLVSSLPISLQPAALTTSLRKVDQDRLVSAVNATTQEAMTWA